MLTDDRLSNTGADLFVRRRSGSPTLLFLHGLAGHGGEWTNVVAALPETFGLIIPDLRGHGRTVIDRAMRSPADEMLNDSAALIRTWAPQGVTVVGQSMGGIVATLLAARRPELVDGLVLLEAGIGALEENDLDDLVAWHDTWPAGLPGPAPIVPELSSEEMRHLMADLGLRSRLDEWSSIVTPTLVLPAASGTLGESEQAEMRSARPDALWQHIPDAGHDAHLDNPEAVAAAIASFVRDR